MLYHISKIELKQQADSEEIWEKALKIHVARGVGILSGWLTQQIHTTVSDRKIYEVTFDFGMDGLLENHTCTCSAAEGIEGLCEHGIAALLKMYDRQERENEKRAEAESGFHQHEGFQSNLLGSGLVKETVNDDMTRQILQMLDTDMEPTEKEIVNVEFQLEFGDHVNLEGYAAAMSLRIGLDRFYIVKDAREFLAAINTGSRIEFSKNFDFNGSRHTFGGKDLQVMTLLLDLYEEAGLEAGEQYVTEGKSSVFERKYIRLSPNRFMKILECIDRERLFISDDNSQYPAVILQQLPALEFQHEVVGNQLCIKLSEPYPFKILDNAFTLVYDNDRAIILPGEDKRTALRHVHELFYTNTELYFPVEYMEEIINAVYPVFKRIGRVVLSEELSDRILRRNLEKRVYLDYREKGIEIKLLFVYGDKEYDPAVDEITPVSAQSKDAIVLRDRVEERAFLRRFDNRIFEKTQTGFKVSGDYNEYVFLSDYAPVLKQESVLYATDSYRDKRVISEARIHQSIRLNETENYLEYNFSIEGISERELNHVLKAYRLKKKYYKLKQGGFISLESQSFEMMHSLMRNFDIKTKELGKDIRLPASAAYYIDHHLDKEEKRRVSRNDSFKRLTMKLKNPQSIDIAVPDRLKKVLRPYQVTGYQWLRTLSSLKMGGILADDMGLGKTVQVLAFLLSKQEDGERATALIVAPTSLVYNWAAEIDKFTPELTYRIVHGTRPERESAIGNEAQCDVFITSYATLRRDIDLYQDMHFSTVILDEAQHVKNESSKVAQSVKKLVASNRFALTGTPMENHLGEFWSIFDFVLPGHLGSRYSFSKLYEKPITKEQDLEKSEALRAMIKPFLLRRLKKDVLPELPEKIESQVRIEMSDEQKKVYAATVSRIRGELDRQFAERGFAGSQLQILSALTRLRQICSHPSVYLEDYDGTSGKFEALRELLAELRESGHRPLIFSQFTSVLKLIREMVVEMNLSYHYLDGQTKARDRGLMVDSFNSGDGDVFLISLKAGGSGLNLTGADTVIHFDPWWNPAVEDQASDRAYRIGQTKNVYVMKLITRGTIEEKIIKLQERKRELIDKVVKPGETFITSLSEDEVRSMFEI